MRFSTAAFVALASVAIATPDADLAKRQYDLASCTLPAVSASVFGAILKALPSSVVAEIQAGSASQVGASIQSEFNAGHTPAWFTESLDANAQSCLPIVYAAATPTAVSATSTPISSTPTPAYSSSAPTVISTYVASATATISPSGNGTVVSTIHSPTLSKTSGPVSLGSSTAAAATSASTGAAAPAYGAFQGAGIAGFLGVLGMLAL